MDRVERQGAVHLQAAEDPAAEDPAAEDPAAGVAPLGGGPVAEEEETREARGPGIEISKR